MEFRPRPFPLLAVHNWTPACFVLLASIVAVAVIAVPLAWPDTSARSAQILLDTQEMRQ